jgi:selenide,water dikinase
LTTSAFAPELFEQLSITKDEKGFIVTRPTLQSVDYDSVFVVGDSGTLKDHPTPKAGVFAVRQGPVLWENINRSLDHRPLIEYKPQRNFLKLLNTGDGKAIVEYKGFSFWNRWMGWLKNRVDTRFIEKYQDYRPAIMASQDFNQETEMRCLGCGGKIGGSLLARVLNRLEVKESDDVVVGLSNPDDCAVIKTEKKSVVVTTDFFAAPVDDPFLAGRIAALNSLSDVFVMGADPQAALAIITLPYGREKNQEELLFQVLSGSLQEFDKCGTSLVGGHTIEGSQLTVGYTILAKPSGDLGNYTKAELNDEDHLILTKPIGSGAVLAASANAACGYRTFESLVKTMTQSNRTAATIAREMGVRAMTDVTGFGLAGHLLEMLKASCLVAEVTTSMIPLIEGAQELFEQGIESTLAPANRDAEIAISVSDALRKTARYRAMFDPQTCGGVLMGAPGPVVAELLDRLRSTGHHDVAEIGRVRIQSENDYLICLK